MVKVHLMLFAAIAHGSYRLWAWWGLSAVSSLALTGCVRPVPPVGTEEYQEQTTVLFEACLPDRRVEFERRPVNLDLLRTEPSLKGWWPVNLDDARFAPTVVDWVEIGKGPGQFDLATIPMDEATRLVEGTQHLELAGRTSGNQPVFRSGLPGEDGSSGYFIVNLTLKEADSPYKDGKIVYWFQVPRIRKPGIFTPWQAASWSSAPYGDPAYVETTWLLRMNRPVDKSGKVPPSAPRMRFMEQSHRDFYSRDSRLRQSKYAAWAQYAHDRHMGEGYAVVPVTDEFIPDCQ